MVGSYKDADLQTFRRTGRSRRIPATVRRIVLRKLLMLEAATVLDSLLIPPGNRLEALKGDRKGQHSIRVNDQYRICFVWRDRAAHDVELMDYH